VLFIVYHLLLTLHDASKIRRKLGRSAFTNNDTKSRNKSSQEFFSISGSAGSVLNPEGQAPTDDTGNGTQQGVSGD